MSPLAWGPPESREALLAALDADCPVLLWGAPGTGKTASVNTLAAERGAVLADVRGSRVDPRDLGVLVPDTASGRLVDCAPDWAHRLRDAVAAGVEAWLLLGELTCCPPAVQAALLGVVQEREIAGVSLAGVRVVADANPADQSAGGLDLDAAPANRWLHVTVEPDLAAWRAWMATAGGRTPGEAAACGLIAGYLGARGPEALLAVPREVTRQGSAWPSPRSWHHAARVIAALAARERVSPQYATLTGAGRTVLAGLVGDTAADEAIEWLSAGDLPDAEALLAGAASLPERGDRCAASLDAAIAAACSPHEERTVRLAAASRLVEEVACDRARPDCAVTAGAVLARTHDAVLSRRLLAALDPGGAS